MKGCCNNSPEPVVPPRLLYENIVRVALEEDIEHGDLTTNLVIDRDRHGRASIVAKELGLCAGTFLVQEVFRQIDTGVEVQLVSGEGDEFDINDEIVCIQGRLHSILIGERVALNFLQRLCGIATLARRFCKRLDGLSARLVCTRKTTPGLRLLEKYALRVGGAFNHRFSLSDGILIKDNHIIACGSIVDAVARARAQAPHTLRIEVEVSNMDELAQALDAGADVILLDNMEVSALAEAVRFARQKRPDVILEASGGITLDNIREIGSTGVDVISVGALTHSYKSIDLSLKVHILEK